MSETGDAVASSEYPPHLAYTEYLEAFRSATARVRFCLAAIVVTSTLVFVGSWNSWRLSWQYARLHQVRTAIAHELWKLPPNQEPADETLRRAATFIRQRNLATEESVTAFRNMLQAIMLERVAEINVPVLGVLVDVNDLGIFGGFAFVVLLMWAAFSLRQVRLILETADRGFKKLVARNVADAKVVYHAFALTHVFGAPPLTVHPRTRWFRWLPRCLFVLPLVVHLAIAGYDIQSRERVFAISVAHTWILFLCEAVWAVLMVILICMCLSSQIDTDNIWQSAFKRLYPGNP